MKVGTDAVIIGSWADVKNSQTILDIGTGSGIIALMMAQKNSEAHIKAIDIDEDSIHEASQNFEQSAWSERLEAECIAFQNFGVILLFLVKVHRLRKKLAIMPGIQIH
jgi:tRNA1Val (adenine37-N6)-methyltransferase